MDNVQGESKELASQFIHFARFLVNEEKYHYAFESYLMAFERDSDLMNFYDHEFRCVLLKLVKSLARCKDIRRMFGYFNRAVTLFPHDTEICNHIGKYLYTYHYHMGALIYFEKVLKINPNHIEAEKNLNSVKNLLVERWHYRMLNDHIRNEYYRHAIHNTIIANKDIVIDVGTGTGLLAIYSREAGAAKVVACEGSEIMAAMAKEVIEYNKLTQIKVINKMSTQLAISRLCTILVTEMFDAGLFGEHVLQMLSHAWQTFLTPDARILPNKAEFFVVGVQCDHLSRKYKLSSESKELLNIPAMNVQVLTDEETYDCEDVHMIKDIKYLTDPVSLVKVNFNDIENIKEILEKTETYKVKLKANEHGVIDNVVGWFNLYLSDTVTITTNPLADNRANAWQQAVFFNDVPKTLKQNEILNLEFLIQGGKLKMFSDSESDINRVSQEIIRFLNDLEYLKMIDNCVEKACTHFEGVTEMSKITIIDVCPFPYFGLQMLKRGALEVLCITRNDNDKLFIAEVCHRNNISIDNITLLDAEYLSPDMFVSNAKYHIIFSHVLEVGGDIDFHLLDIYLFWKKTCLHENGLFLPHEIKLMGQLVSCHWLDINNKLYDENVSNYKIARSINKYQVTQNFFIDFSLLRYVPISNPVEVCKYPVSKIESESMLVDNDFDEACKNQESTTFETVSVPIINNGLANAILCWYKTELLKEMEEISTNRPGSFNDGTLFLTNSKTSLEVGQTVTLEQYKNDRAFKLSLIT